MPVCCLCYRPIEPGDQFDTDCSCDPLEDWHFNCGNPALDPNVITD